MDRQPHINGLTVIAMAFIAYAVANITHEIIGHCGMALVMGTPCTVVSSFYNPLTTLPPTWKYNMIVVAGSAANFAAGLVCVAILRRTRRHTASHYPRAHAPPKAILTWLLMAVNLFLPSTYIMAAPLIKFGDSYLLIYQLSGLIFWRAAVALAGATALWFSFRVCRIELARLIGARGREARMIAWRVVVPAYVAGGILWVASALFSPLDWRIAQLEAAGGTFGLTIWLLLLPLFLPQIETPEGEPLSLPQSRGWIIAGALTAILFIGIWGRGFAL